MPAKKIESDWIGKKAPAFTLLDQNEEKHQLTKLKGEWVVLFWYPKDMTSGCTKEVRGFNDTAAQFKKLGVNVFGASILDTASKKEFADKHGITYPLLADPASKVAEKYGVWQEKSMYGRKFMGISRETFIIDPSGKIATHWPKAKGSEDHAVEALDWLKANMDADA